MIGTMLIIAATVFASYQSSAKLRKNMWLSVTFPRSDVNQQEILDIVQQFKKHNLRFFLITIILMLPVLLIKPTSLILVYITLWTVFVMLYENQLFCKYNSRLLLLKSRKLWFTGEDYHLLDRSRIQRQRHKLLHRFFPTALDQLISMAEEPIYVDDDEYWINGYYYNPDDRRTTVEKRVGIGTTANMATKAGKFTIYGSVIFVAAILIPMFIMFVRMDFITFQMVAGDTSVRFEAPLYSYEFALSEIEEVSLSYTLPKGGLRTNGAATEEYLLGNFRYDEYGKTKMYVYRNYPPYLVIKLADRTVFYNSKLEEETLLAYEFLLQKTEFK
jgi:hypothetical protein